MVAKSDLELIMRINLGEKEAFAELVKRYQKKVYNTVLRMLGNKDDANDMAQETFIKVYQNLSSFKGTSSFSTWLFKVTTNLCRDELRKRKRDLVVDHLDQKENKEIQLADSSTNPEEISLTRERIDQLQTLLNKLPDAQKEVIVLRDVQGFSYQEIAEIIGVNMGTVKSRISRGRQTLKSELTNMKGVS